MLLLRALHSKQVRTWLGDETQVVQSTLLFQQSANQPPNMQMKPSRTSQPQAHQPRDHHCMRDQESLDKTRTTQQNP